MEQFRLKTEATELYSKAYEDSKIDSKEVIGKWEPVEYEGSHDIQSENSKQIFECETCFESYTRIELYNLHKIVHNPLEALKGCPYCSFKYKNADSYMSHIQKHLNSYRHCMFCQKIFFNQKVLQRHVIEHKKNGDLACNYCGKTFTVSKLLTVHLRVHTNERPYKCDKCDKSFKQLGSVATHRNTVHSEEKMKVCKICQGKFATGSSLNRHIKRIHNSDEKLLCCKECKKEFPNQESFYQHKMDEHMTFSTYYKVCLTCNEEFFVYHHYIEHRKKHIKDEYAKEPEPILELKHMAEDILKAEAIEPYFEAYEDSKIDSEEVTIKCEPPEYEGPNDIQSENAKPIFECEICFESYTRIELYNLHKTVHNPVDALKRCPCCSVKYKKSASYMAHIQKHLNSYRHCMFCQKIFFNQNLLQRHVIEHKNNGDLACKYCGKTFRVSKLLTVHLRVHTNERPYKCDKCDKTFKQLSSASSHRNTVHSEEKMKECKICQGKFATGSSLNRHIKRMHNNDGKSLCCKTCKKEFPNQESFYKHKMDEHLKFSTYYKVCFTCNEEFFVYHHYMEHRRKHIRYEHLKEPEPTLELNNMLEDINVKNQTSKKCWLCGEDVPHEQYNDHKNEHMLMTSQESLECNVSQKFPCKICKKICSTEINFLGHMDVHMEKKYKCLKECSAVNLFTYIGLKRHESRFHRKSNQICDMPQENLTNKNNTVACTLCGFEVVRKEYGNHKNDHMEITDEELLKYRASNTFPCKQCDKICSHINALFKHTDVHMPKKYTCLEECDFKRSLYTYRGLKLHQHSYHEIFVCRTCNTNLEGFLKYKVHCKRTKCPLDVFVRGRKFQCLWCPAIFFNRAMLAGHYQTHKRAVSGYKCHVCDKQFSRLMDIKKHMIVAHDQTFSSKDYLIDGTSSIKPSTPFKCKLCKDTFVTQSALRKHNVKHKTLNNQCKKCKGIFKFTRYKRHVKTKECSKWIIEALIPEVFDLNCLFCDKTFSIFYKTSRHILEKHALEHYQCKFCESSYPLKSFRNHLIKQHPNEKKYVCIGCKASFVTLTEFAQHRRHFRRCLLSHTDPKCNYEKETNIDLVDSGNDHIVDIPEKVLVTTDGNVIIPESNVDSEGCLTDVDYLERYILSDSNMCVYSSNMSS